MILLDIYIWSSYVYMYYFVSIKINFELIFDAKYVCIKFVNWEIQVLHVHRHTVIYNLYSVKIQEIEEYIITLFYLQVSSICRHIRIVKKDIAENRYNNGPAQNYCYNLTVMCTVNHVFHSLYYTWSFFSRFFYTTSD